MNKNMIDTTTLIRCGWCSKETEAKEWNKLTLDACITKEMRDSFKSVYLTKGFDIKRVQEHHYYKCPKCGTWNKQTQLKIINSGIPELDELGGESVFIEVDAEDI